MGVCVVENLSRVFLFEWPHLHLWVMRVYIVWVKGKKVTLKKILQAESLAGISREGLTHEIDSLARLFSFQSCASHMPFLREPFS